MTLGGGDVIIEIDDEGTDKWVEGEKVGSTEGEVDGWTTTKGPTMPDACPAWLIYILSPFFFFLFCMFKIIWKQFGYLLFYAFVGLDKVLFIYPSFLHVFFMHECVWWTSDVFIDLKCSIEWATYPSAFRCLIEHLKYLSSLYVEFIDLGSYHWKDLEI